MAARMAATETLTTLALPDARLLERIPWVFDDGIAIVDRRARWILTWANPALHALLEADPGTLVGVALAELPASEIEFGADHPAPPGELDLEVLLDHADGATATCSLERPDGSTVKVAVTARPLEGDPDGAWVLRLCEVAAQLRTDALLRSSEERFRALATHAPIGVALSDVGVRLGYVNARLAEMWGRPIDEVCGDGWMTSVIAEDLDDLVDGLVSVLAGEEQRRSFRVDRPDGTRRCIDARLTPVRFVGHGAGFVASMEDVTEARDREERLAWQASHDSLTGLPNRLALRQETEAVLEHSQGEGVALLFFDLDDFKLVNDSLGHQAGDQLLQGVADRLQSNLRSGDLVARLGGDEFVVLCQQVEDEDEALMVADRLLAQLSAPMHLHGTDLRVSASVGVVLADGRIHADDLLRDADVAMYQAKNGGKSRTAIFEETQRQVMQSRLELVTGLRNALEAGDIGLAYQPIVDLRSGRIIGAEALLRFQDPNQGLVSAETVVGLAEDTGCIVELGGVVLRLAAQQLAAWRSEGRGPDYVAVNLAARQFSEDNLVDLVVDALEQSGLVASDICLELTETHLMAEVDKARVNLAKLELMGVQVAIDDFGAGYSSLSYLRRIPAGRIKIDRSFIDDVDRDPDSAAIVGAITAMTRALGRSVVAEGVETVGQLQAVRALGCDAVQGYLLGRPVPGDDFPREVQVP